MRVMFVMFVTLNRLLAQIVDLMRANDAPAEACRRFGLVARDQVETV